ncbi:MAG: DUF3108 domain-containing protein [Thiotrichaceae bacterium]|nr:DUF3108 domain-containing protein [Thiotrichaceae bacterium]
MLNNYKTYRLYLFFVLFFSANISAATHPSTWPFDSGETLHYKLSYQGLLTSFLWADLADVQLSFRDHIKLFDTAVDNEQNGLQFIVNVSTENYLKAELIQPVRYSYIATTNTFLKKTLLVENIDQGYDKRHEFLWLDWKNKSTQLFEIVESETHDTVLENIAEFFIQFPPAQSQKQNLLYKKSGDSITPVSVLDPLSLIYYLRTQDDIQENEIFIAISDDIRKYKIEHMDKEILRLNGQAIVSNKYKIQTDEKKNKFYYVWLADDKKKIPLRFAMDAPLGHLNIDLLKYKLD